MEDCDAPSWSLAAMLGKSSGSLGTQFENLWSRTVLFNATIM